MIAKRMVMWYLIYKYSRYKAIVKAIVGRLRFETSGSGTSEHRLYNSVRERGLIM